MWIFEGTIIRKRKNTDIEVGEHEILKTSRLLKHNDRKLCKADSISITFEWGKDE